MVKQEETFSFLYNSMGHLLFSLLATQSVFKLYKERTLNLVRPSLRIRLVSDVSGGVWVFWNCFTRSACRKHLLGASWWYQTAHLSSFSFQRFHLLLGLLIDAFCKIVRPSQQFQKKNLFLLIRVLRMNSISYPQDDYFILIHIYYLAFAHFFTLKHFASTISLLI